MTYAALEEITGKQLSALRYLRELAGNPSTWVDDCRLILGAGWDGNFRHLSVAAGSWLIGELRRGLRAVADADDDLQIGGARL